MDIIMKALVSVIALLCAAGIWCFGIGLALSVVVIILKLSGLEMVQTISYLMPIQMLGGWGLSFVGLLISTLFMQRKGNR